VVRLCHHSRVDSDTRTAIWNRAAMAGGGAAPGPGDAALSTVLSFHSLVMNGGLDHALDMLTPDDLRAAVDGYRYLGMDSVAIAEVVRGATAALSDEDDDLLDELGARYDDLASDETIDHRFAALTTLRPDDFAPTT